RAAGRDFAGDRDRAQAEAPPRREESDRTARHDQRGGLQAVPDGAPIQRHRKRRRRPPQRVDHPALPTRHRDRSRLCACVGADGATRAARRALERAEKVIAQDPDNGSAMSFAVGALAVLGETERAKEWAERAMLLDPDNMNMKYNFACMLVTDLHDYEGALD